MSRFQQPWSDAPKVAALCVRVPVGSHYLLIELREVAARHDDTAWVDVRPPTTRDGLAVLSQDLLTASAVVGLRPPRTHGERHLWRVLPHWITGPVREVILSGAQWLPAQTLEELRTAAALAGVRLWWLVHEPVPTPLWPYLGAVAEPTDLSNATITWRSRAMPPQLCPALRPDYWTEQVTSWPTGGGCLVHDGRVRCFLSAARRALITADVTGEMVRDRLVELLELPDTSIDDQWAARDAGRDPYTPAVDAITHLVRTTQASECARVEPMLGDLAVDCTAVNLAGRRVHVPAHMRPVLARQRLTQALVGVDLDEPLLNVFGNPAR